MTSAPTGLITFLLTDIEGSSALWEEDPEGMGAALAVHDRLLREAIATNRGRVFATAGDSLAAAFHKPSDAVNAALEAQSAVSDLVAGGKRVRVRMAVHAGEAEERHGDYFGPVLNRCGRLRDAAHGGQVVISGAVSELLTDGAASGIDLLDLGEHRLRDLEKPERIFQVARHGVQDSFPPLRTLTRATTNLPVQLTSFVGRDHELEEVAKIVRGSRLVTLTGVGGSGKTRLAMQAAAAINAEFSDGVWLVDLAPISEPELVVDAVADVFALGEQANRSRLDSLVGYLRNRHLLVLIDNCEHLLDAVGQVAHRVLGACPNVRVMATSREVLRLPGEVAYLVPALSLPDAGQPDDAALMRRFDAVRLFVNRAETAQPGFRLTTDAVGVVVEICRRLDGIPLAIELAAARLATFTPQQIARHLDDRFRLLSRGRRGGLRRQETLQATFDWSYELLDESEQLLFTRVSVFRSDFSLEAAEGIVAADQLNDIDLMELLPRLIEKSLVVAEPTAGEMRYRLLETVRQYAADRWDTTGETSSFEARHAGFFLDLAEEGAASLGQSAKHDEWMDRLTSEADNFRQALRWCLDSGKDETGMRLAGALYRFWLYKERFSEGAWWLEALTSRRATVPEAVEAKALLALGTLSGALMGKGRAGIAALRKAVELYGQLPSSHRVDHASSLNNLAQLLGNVGEYAEAEARLEEALAISRELGALWGVAIQLGNLAQLAGVDGRTEQARDRIEQSILVAREVNSRSLMAQILVNKAEFERDWGSPEVAIVAYEQAIEELAVTKGDRIAETAAGMGIVYLRLGDLQRALELFLPNAAVLCSDQGLAEQTHIIANLALGRAEIDLAVGAVQEAAYLLGFVGRWIDAGEMQDFVHRHRKLLADVQHAMEPEVLTTALARGRAMNFAQARQAIARSSTAAPPT